MVVDDNVDVVANDDSSNVVSSIDDANSDVVVLVVVMDSDVLFDMRCNVV